MQERRSLFYTLEELDTMKDTKKLETTNKDIIIDTLYVRVNYSNQYLNICKLYFCDANGVELSSGIVPYSSNINYTSSKVLLTSGGVEISGGYTTYMYLCSLEWSGSRYYNFYQAFPESEYGKLYIPIRIGYVKYKSGTTVNNSDSVPIYYKEA